MRGRITGKKPQYHPGEKIELTPRQAFEIAVGAILTQNTAWTNVEKALNELNRRNLIDPCKILSTRYSALSTFIRSSGYFTQKAKKLKVLARFVEQEADGNMLNLKKNSTESLRSKFLALWGVGPETADSILLYALTKPVFVVDAYTRRIGGRLGWPFKKKTYDEIRLFFERLLPGEPHLYQEFHALLVELAKRHCLKSDPACFSCPLKSICVYGTRRRLE
ncbi:MAG: hypothetical protein HY401_10595 [Elusimicrobia bacterium]|nr:hypothetical protein [Elusimicrobiota bacterium]